jgi:hypothetical protein
MLSGSTDDFLRTWDARTGEPLLTFHLLPEGDWLVFDERAGKPVRCSPGAWLWAGWNELDAEGVMQRLPLEAFGPVEGLD